MFPSDSSKHRKKPLQYTHRALVWFCDTVSTCFFITYNYSTTRFQCTLPIPCLENVDVQRAPCRGLLSGFLVFGSMSTCPASRWTNRKTLNQHWRVLMWKLYTWLHQQSIHWTFNMLLWKQHKFTQCKCVYLREDIIFRRKVVKVAKLYNVNRG